MELAETIDTINQTLENLYGADFTSKLPLFRIVWSNDQYEKRLMPTTDDGFYLLVPQVREVPKYRQWIMDRYVLERLVLVPEMNQKELADIKISYEPLYVFQNAYTDTYLPPRIDACQFVIDSLYAAMGKKSMRAKYIDPEMEYPDEIKEERIKHIMEELYGNETDVTDALRYHEGVAVPSNYKADSPTHKGEDK